MFSTQVSFIPLEGCCSVVPPIIKDRLNSIYVLTSAQDEKDIRETACRKITACYGILFEITGIYNQFEY